MVESSQVIQFVRYDSQTGEMEVTAEAMGFLSSLPAELKLAPVAVVGPISSGKSYLCNMLAEGISAFEVAKVKQTTSTTCGIHIWTKIIDLEGSNQGVLLMDTQGLSQPTQLISVGGLRSPRNSSTQGSTASLRSPRIGSGSTLSSGASTTQPKAATTDKLFQLISLLASTLVFNQLGGFSDRLLEYLEPLSRLNEALRKQEPTQQLQAAHLVCILRDHVDLDLHKTASFVPQTPTQLLEIQFKQCSSLAVKKQKLQEQLQRLFKQRKCLTLPQPQNLSQDESFELEASKDFRQELSKVSKALLQSTQLKKVGGKVLNGSMLLSLALDYAAALQRPDNFAVLLTQAIERAASEETERQQEYFYSRYEQYLLDHWPSLPLKTLQQQYVAQISKEKANLRQRLAEYLPFGVVCDEVREFEKRALISAQSRLNENYSIAYQLSADVLTKLCNSTTEITGQTFSIQSKWLQILSDYSHIDTENMYDVFAEACCPSGTFVDYTRVQAKEHCSALGDEDDHLPQSVSKEAQLRQELPRVLQMLSADVCFAQSTLSAQLSQLESDTQAAYTHQQALEQQKSHNEGAINAVQSQTQQTINATNDLVLHAESLQRQIESERHNIKNLEDFKEVSDAKQSQAQHSHLEELTQAIGTLQAKLNETKQQLCGIEDDIAREQTAHSLDLKKYDTQTQQVKDQIFHLEKQLSQSSADKSIMFRTTQDFLQRELPEKYLNPMRQLLTAQKSTIALKKELFERQKSLNSTRMQLSEQLSDTRQCLEEASAKQKIELQQSVAQVQRLCQEHGRQLAQLRSGKLEKEQKLNEAILECVGQTEAMQVLFEQTESVDEKCEQSLAQIVASRSNIVQQSEQMMQLEEEAYEYTITNQARIQIRESLIALLPDIVTAVASRKPQTGTDRLMQGVRSVDDDAIRSKLAQMFKKYKLVQ